MLSGALSFGTAGANTRYNIDGTGISTWYVAGSTAMTLNSTGLGVGAATPAYKLDVRSGATSITAQFASTATTAYTPSAYTGDKARLLLTGGNGTGATIGFALSSGGSNENYFGVVQESGGSGAFVWQGYNGSTYGERMRIDSSGNVGIGVTSPTYKLQAAVASGANRNIFAAQIAGASNGFEILWNHATTTTRVIINAIPTSAAGLASGTLWNDSGTIKIA
jgi:hypothetical protein